MQLKKGDIVRIKNPFPDENPNLRYLIVQESIEEFSDTDQIDCMLLDTDMYFKPISRIEKCDLELCN